MPTVTGLLSVAMLLLLVLQGVNQFALYILSRIVVDHEHRILRSEGKE